VLKDSPIRSLADLQGKEVVFPHAAAFFGYHLPMDALLRMGIQVKPLFAGNQEGAMGQLKVGRTEAAGINADVMRAFAKREQMLVPGFVAAHDRDFDNMRRFYRTTLVKIGLR
jgi:phosphonate transport system substrate-binding protein